MRERDERERGEREEREREERESCTNICFINIRLLSLLL